MHGPSGNRRLVPFLDRQKNVAIPAIRAAVNAEIMEKMAILSHFFGLSARFLCQVPLFHFREKSALAS
jgi:hypothetical protein